MSSYRYQEKAKLDINKEMLYPEIVRMEECGKGKGSEEKRNRPDLLVGDGKAEKDDGEGEERDDGLADHRCLGSCRSTVVASPKPSLFPILPSVASR